MFDRVILCPTVVMEFRRDVDLRESWERSGLERSLEDRGRRPLHLGTVENWVTAGSAGDRT